MGFPAGSWFCFGLNTLSKSNYQNSSQDLREEFFVLIAVCFEKYIAICTKRSAEQFPNNKLIARKGIVMNKEGVDHVLKDHAYQNIPLTFDEAYEERGEALRYTTTMIDLGSSVVDEDDWLALVAGVQG